VHPDAPDWAEEMRRIASEGLKGVKIHPVYQGVDIDDPRYLRILTLAGELGLIVVMHAGNDIGFPGVVRCSPQMTYNALRQAGPVCLVMAHMGGWRNWDEAEMLAETSLEDNKLVNVIFCKTANANLLSITIHHFLVDPVSWELLINDLKTTVEQIKNNADISLPSKTASFKLWCEELQKYSEEISEETKKYWSSINEKLNNSKPLYAYAEENDAEKYTFDFDKLFTDKLINVANKTYGTRTQELLLTALGRAAGSLAHGNAGIIVESHGRTDLNNYNRTCLRQDPLVRRCAGGRP
jgi:hypothetical protein